MLAEYHQPPDYFLDTWTDEEFERYWECRNYRLRETRRQIEEAAESPGDRKFSAPQPVKRVTDTELFQMMGIAPQSAGRA